MTTVIGIDPGRSGGIAWNSVGEGVRAVAMPRDEAEVINLLRDIIRANSSHPIIAYIELVTGFVVKPRGEACRLCNQPIEKGEPGSRMFTFGRGVGAITGALHMASIDIEEVAPRTWQKPYYVTVTEPDGRRLTKSERKRALRDIAQRRFQQIEVTLKTADALLIHAYGVAQIGSELEGIAHPHHAVTLPGAFNKDLSKPFAGLKRKVKTPAAGRSKVQEGPPPFAIGNWNGTPYVMAKSPTKEGYEMIRKASAIDIERFPKVAA